MSALIPCVRNLWLWEAHLEKLGAKLEGCTATEEEDANEDEEDGERGTSES